VREPVCTVPKMYELGKALHLYDPKDFEQFANLLRLIYERVKAFEDDHEMIVFYAAVAYSVAFVVKHSTNVDLCTLPPLPKTQPILLTVQSLDRIIAAQLQTLGSTTEMRDVQAESLARFEAGLIWKAYLFCLNTPPNEWASDALCALESLHILSAVTESEVVKIITNVNQLPIAGGKPKDWPPPGFIKFYSANIEHITFMLHREFG
jgi:hypothetical protein